MKIVNVKWDRIIYVDGWWHEFLICISLSKHLTDLIGLKHRTLWT